MMTGANCSCCGKTVKKDDRGWYHIADVPDWDFNSDIGLCLQCVREMAMAIGMLPEKKANSQREELKALRKEVKELREADERYRDIMNALQAEYQLASVAV